MGSRIFHVVVVVLWLSTMSWLLVSKVLPPLMVGEPPTYRSTIPKSDQVVCWHLIWNDQPRGWAATKMVAGVEGVTEIHSRVVLNEPPLEDMAPPWLARLIRKEVGKISMDVKSLIQVDFLGRLCGLRSSVDLSRVKGAIVLSGDVVEGQLKLHVRAGEAFSVDTEQPLPPGALIANEMVPQGELRDLRVGQTWTTPTYSPFRPHERLVDILQATVEKEDFVQWDGQVNRVWLVVYRNDAGKARGRMWVDFDGKVLKQETNIFNAHLQFVRMTADETRAYADLLNADWLAKLDVVSPRHLEAAAP